VLIGRDRSRLTKVISDLNGKRNLLAVKADITKEADVINVIEETVSAFDTVDILVNNAGILNDPTPFHKMTDEQWTSLINTNLIGTFRTTKAVLPIMMEKETWEHCQYIFVAGYKIDIECTVLRLWSNQGRRNNVYTNYCSGIRRIWNTM